MQPPSASARVHSSYNYNYTFFTAVFTISLHGLSPDVTSLSQVIQHKSHPGQTEISRCLAREGSPWINHYSYSRKCCYYSSCLLSYEILHEVYFLFAKAVDLLSLRIYSTYATTYYIICYNTSPHTAASMTDRVADGDPDTDVGITHPLPQSTIDDPRMKLYVKREKAFYEFLEDCNQEMPAAEEAEEEVVVEERPLSGLQCLLALTEILDRASQLRASNYHLEQRIEILQRFKFIAEVQNELHNATLDINANGVVRSKKGKFIDDIDDGRMKRAYSAESLDAFTPTTRLDNSMDEFSKHRAGTGKGSKLSETWGKVKERLVHKEYINTTPSTGKSSRRHRSADIAGSMRVSVSLDSPSPSHTTSATVPVQFTQRQIDISPPQADDGDFGGVWLGGDVSDGATATATAATAATQSVSMEYGGVWLGPPSIVHLHRDEDIVHPEPGYQHSNEKLERKSSEPATLNRVVIKSDYQNKFSADITSSRIRTCSYDESQKSKNKDNLSPTFLRKKSSKLLAQASLLLPGSEQKKVKKLDPSTELPKEFRKKIEEWHVRKEVTPTEEATQPVAAHKPAATQPFAAHKSTKAGKQKTPRFKSKKRSGLMKQRSKSAERVEDNFSSSQHSEDFEEKLREWSLKQGFHATYYSDVRRQTSTESVGGLSLDHKHPLNKCESLELSKVHSDNCLTVNTQVSSSCTNSTASISPAVTLDSFYSAENLQTLYEISQSSDVVFCRNSRRSANSARKLSRSDEALNTTSTSHAMMSPLIGHSSSANNSHVDLYARASDHSLEKHLSLCHMTSECSIDLLSTFSTEHFEQPLISTQSVHKSVNSVQEDCNMQQNNSDMQQNICDMQQNNSNMQQNNSDMQQNICDIQQNNSDMQQNICDIQQNMSNYDVELPVNIRKDETISDTTNDSTVPDAATGTEVAISIAADSEIASTVVPVTTNIHTNDSSKVDVCDEPQTLHNFKFSDTTQQHLLEQTIPDRQIESTADLNTDTEAVDDKTTVGSVNTTETEELSSIDQCGIVKASHGTQVQLSDSLDCNTESRGPADDNHATSEKYKETKSDISLANENITPTSSDKVLTLGADKTTLKISADIDDLDYDINSNVTNNDSVADMLVSNRNNCEIEASTTPPLYVGTEVPLKLRLKSLAMEYEMEDSKREQRVSNQSNTKSSTHKRTRSYDLFSNTTCVSSRPLSFTNKANLTSGYQSGEIHKASSSPESPTGLGQNGFLINGSQGSKPQLPRSNIHQLKSAGELIYGQSPPTNPKQFTRSASSFLPRLDIRSRRELYEKPKEGTVKKAMSMFRDGGTFNAHFGTDFARTSRPQPT